MQENFSMRLSRALTLRGIKPIELSEKTGLPKSGISQYLSGACIPKDKNVRKIAEILNINPDWLLGHSVQMDIIIDNNISKDINNKRIFPILGVVKAGYNYLARENWIGHISIDKEVSDPENYYALKISGDSMQPILYENDIVLVHQQNDVESGQIGIVLIDNEEATVKKIIKYEDYIELIAFNSYYPPKKLTQKNNFKIIGKVTEARISKIFE